MAFIYKTTNIINNKIYIGKSKFNNPNYLGSGLRITGAIKKYGKTSFTKIILEECADNEVNDREIFWIRHYNSTDNLFGYNISKGGEGGNHYWATLTEEQRIIHNQKISDSKRGKSHKPHTSDTKKKQSDSFWKHAQDNPTFFKERSIAKRKTYVCVNHNTNTVYQTTNLEEFCKEHNLNFGAMRHNARTRKNFYDKIWSCSLENFDNLIDEQIIQLLEDEVYKNNKEYRAKISQSRKNKINGTLYNTN